MKDEKRNDGAGDKLGVVILGDVGCRGMPESDEEADASRGAEGARQKQRKKQSRRKRFGVPERAAKAGNGHHDSGEDGEALGSFRLSEDAGPDHVDRKAGDANHASRVADPIAPARGTEGIDGDDDACKSNGDGE